MEKSKAILSIVILFHFCLYLLPSALAISSEASEGYTINGRVKIERSHPVSEPTILMGTSMQDQVDQLATDFPAMANRIVDMTEKYEEMTKWIENLKESEDETERSLMASKEDGDLIFAEIKHTTMSIQKKLLERTRKTIDSRSSSSGMGTKGFSLPGKLSNAKVIFNGGQKVTFLGPDGYFSFLNVTAGTHLIEVAAIGYFFSPVRIDVSARNHGKVQAALTENRRGLSELVLEPLREEHYYEIREPFSIMSLVKSPMGLMVGFMLIVVFLMPKLVENMDPEEMKRAQEEMRNQGVPSLSSLLPGAGRSN